MWSRRIQRYRSWPYDADGKIKVKELTYLSVLMRNGIEVPHNLTFDEIMNAFNPKQVSDFNFPVFGNLDINDFDMFTQADNSNLNQEEAILCQQHMYI